MILTYLFIGVVFTFLVDLLIVHLTKTNHLVITNNSLDLSWDNSQRVLCVILWPFAMVVFLIAFIRTWFN